MLVAASDDLLEVRELDLEVGQRLRQSPMTGVWEEQALVAQKVDALGEQVGQAPCVAVEEGASSLAWPWGTSDAATS